MHGRKLSNFKMVVHGVIDIVYGARAQTIIDNRNPNPFSPSLLFYDAIIGLYDV